MFTLVDVEFPIKISGQNYQPMIIMKLIVS